MIELSEYYFNELNVYLLYEYYVGHYPLFGACLTYTTFRKVIRFRHQMGKDATQLGPLERASVRHRAAVGSVQHNISIVTR